MRRVPIPGSGIARAVQKPGVAAKILTKHCGFVGLFQHSEEGLENGHCSERTDGDW